MASKVAKTVQGGIKAWLLPEISDVKIQLAETRGDIRSLQVEVDSLRKEITDDISRVGRRLKTWTNISTSSSGLNSRSRAARV